MKLISTIIAGALCILAPTTTIAQKAFDKGDRKADLTVGIGLVAYPDESKMTFDQHLGMEWGVANFGNSFTLGLGFTINNTYGGTIESMIAGTYDYSYNRRSYGQVYKYSTQRWESFDDSKKVHRQGVGTAEADISREDINGQFTIAVHYSVSSRLDTYMKVGAGVGYMHWMTSSYRNESGFKSANVDEYNESKLYKTHDKYSFNDLDHTKWEGLKSKVVPAMSVYLGATYKLTERWGVDMQAGLISANIKGSKKGYPNSYSVFALGCSYHF